MVWSTQRESVDVPFLDARVTRARPCFVDDFGEVPWHRSNVVDACQGTDASEERTGSASAGVNEDRTPKIADGQNAMTAREREFHERESRQAHRTRFRYGLIARSVLIPKGVNESTISATYQDVVREVRVAMPGEVVTEGERRIPIKKF